MNGTWTRRCHKCDKDFRATTRHGQICPTCQHITYLRLQERNKRPVVNSGRLFQERMEKIKRLGITLLA